MPLLQNYKRKQVQRVDLPKLVDLLAACEAVDHLETNRSLAELQRGFDNRPPNTIRHYYLWETPDGQTIAYAIYGIREVPTDPDAYPSVKVHPDYREGNLEAEILSWCEQEIHKLRPDATLWVSARLEFSPHHPRKSSSPGPTSYVPGRPRLDCHCP